MDTEYIKNIKNAGNNTIEGTMYFPLFKTEINVIIYAGESKINYAGHCASYLYNLDKSIIERITKYAFRYFTEYKENIIEDEYSDMPEDTEEKDILNYVYPGFLIIEEKCRENIIEFHMECGCEWEPEHGLEITISDGKVLYLGAFDDMPPYYKERLDYAGYFDPASDMNINYADKE